MVVIKKLAVEEEGRATIKRVKRDQLKGKICREVILAYSFSGEEEEKEEEAFCGYCARNK